MKDSNDQPSSSSHHQAGQCNTITSLTPAMQSWTIRCQVIRSGDLKVYETNRSTGCILKILIADEKGTKIEAIMFNEMARLYDSVFLVGQAYEISNARVKFTDVKYKCARSDSPYEIIILPTTKVKSLPQGLLVQTMSIYHYVPLSSIDNNSNQQIDFVAVVLQASDATKYGKEPNQILREITVIDDTCSHPLPFTLWHNYATKEGSIIMEQLKKKTLFIAAMGINVRFYKGITLATGANTIIEINPDRPEVQRLQSWANQNVSKVENEITATEINNATEEIIVEGAMMKAWVVAMANKEPWYIACNTCRKKSF